MTLPVNSQAQTEDPPLFCGEKTNWLCKTGLFSFPNQKIKTTLSLPEKYTIYKLHVP